MRSSAGIGPALLVFVACGSSNLLISKKVIDRTGDSGVHDDAGTGGSNGSEAGVGGTGGAFGSGGAVGAGGSLIGDAAAGGAADGGAIETTTIVGSYDLVLQGVVRSVNLGFPGGAPPSEGASLRLDLRKGTKTDYEAIVTPRWGVPAAFSATVSGASLVLAGQTSFRDDNLGVEDQWTAITLRIGPNGGLLLGSGVTAVGEETLIESGSTTISGGGDLERDERQPEVSADSASPNGPDNALLPWDPIVVHAAEPIPADALAAALSLDVNGQTVPLAFDFDPTDPALSWAGIATARGHAKAWDAMSHGGTGLLTSSGSAPPLDPSGNSLRAISTSLGFVNPGNAFSEVTFTGGDFALWGSVKWWPYTDAAKPCESGDCLQIGPFDHGYCETPRTGIAVWLSVFVPAAAFRVYYRVFTADPSATYDAAFTVEATAPGGAVTSVAVTPDKLSDLGPSGAPLEYATDFLTVDVAIPAGFQIPGTLGVAIYGGRGADGPCGGPANMPVTTAVIIDHIGATG